TLDAELEPLLLSKAAQFGLPASWVSRLDRRDPERRQVLRVRGTVADSHAASQLRCGDMVLAIAGTPVTCFRDVEAIILAQEQPEATAACPVPHYVAAEGAVGLCEQAPPGQHLGKKRKAEEVLEKPSQENEAQQGQQAPICKASAMAGSQATQELVGVDAQIQDSAHTGSVARPHTTAPVTEQAASPLTPLPSLPITIFRGTELMQVTVQLGSEAGMGTSRVLHWCGAQLQSSHRAVRELGSLPQGAGVYISRWHHGSPAHRYGLYALHWITEANGQPTPDLDTFLEVVRGLGHGEFVRIKMHHLETCQPKVLTLKLDLNYWPTS
ncbi:PDZ domain-containing protein, partial [Haematococcus lacustris]